LRPGDLAAIFLIWYSLVRFVLEYMRAGYNWTFFGIPTAQVVSLLFVAVAIVILLYRHRPGARVDEVAVSPADPDAGRGAAGDSTERLPVEPGPIVTPPA
jgi:prolipoprotein diacylglyceryltransferase